MAKYRYKNVSKNVVVVIGVGQVAPDDVLSTDTEVTNPDLQLIDNPSTSQVPPANNSQLPTNQKGTPMTNVQNAGGTK